MLNSLNRSRLDFAYRQTLLNICKESKIEFSKKRVLGEFITRELTYEQLLTIFFNPKRTQITKENLEDHAASVVLQEIKIIAPEFKKLWKLMKLYRPAGKKKVEQLFQRLDKYKKPNGEIDERIMRENPKLYAELMKYWKDKKVIHSLSKRLEYVLGKLKAGKRYLPHAATGITTAVAATFIYGATFQDETSRCLGLIGSELTKCFWKAQLAGHLRALSVIQKGKAQCMGAKSPEKCNARYDKLIEERKKKIQKLKWNLAEIH